MSIQDSKAAVKRLPKPFWELVKVQGKLALREPTSVIFGVALPIFLLIIFGLVPAFSKPIAGTNLTVFQVYIPILMVTALIMIGLLGLPLPIVRDREIGYLRRVSTTPVSPTKLLAAQVTINLILAVIAFVIVGAGSVLIFGVKAAFEIPGFVLSIALATTAMFSLGLVIAALATTQGAASGMAMGFCTRCCFSLEFTFQCRFYPVTCRQSATIRPWARRLRLSQAPCRERSPRRFRCL